MSKDFKTSLKFGLQPVTTSNIFLKLLELYLAYFRPSTDADDFLFISSTGKQLRLGKLVTKFFKRTLNLHLTTNSVRSVVECGAQTLHLRGEISNEERASVLNINGHSEATMERYYLKRVRGNDVVNATSVFDQLLPSRSDEAEMISPMATENRRKKRIIGTSLMNNPPEEVVATGCDHSHYNSPMKRIPWSAAEINYVGKWCQKHSKCPNVVAQCLKAIRNDKNALKVFHPSHIEDSGRLRYGHDLFKNTKDF
jgi:hypothetical protein